MFDANKGWVHFLFADEDTYIKDSLVVLDRQGNLYYELKKENYAEVIFVELETNHYKMTCYDEASEQLLLGSRKLKFGVKFQKQNNKEEQNISVYTLARGQKDIMLEMLSRMMSKGCHCAFVFDIDAMASFQGISMAQKILMKQREEKNGNILVIVSDTNMDTSFPILTNPDGIFQTEAFPEIYNLCKEHKNVRLYDCMTQKLPECICYLNEVNWDEIHNLVLRSVMVQGTKLKERICRLDDYTNFLWLMTWSLKFARQMREKFVELDKIFPENETRSFSAMQKALRFEKAYEQMEQCIEELRAGRTKEDLLELVKVDDKGKEHQRFLHRDNQVWKTFRRLSINSIALLERKGNKVNMDKMKRKISMIEQQLFQPYLISDQEAYDAVQKFIVDCLEYMKEANFRCDCETIKIGMDALYYATCKCEQQYFETSTEHCKKAGNDARMKCYEKALKLQNSISIQEERIQEYKAEVKAKEKLIADLDEKIESMEEEYPDIAQRGDLYLGLTDKYNALIDRVMAEETNKNATELLLKNITDSQIGQEKARNVALLEIKSIEDAESIAFLNDFAGSTDYIKTLIHKTNQMEEFNEEFFNELMG